MAYVPGPKEDIPWADSVGSQAGSTDALADGQIHQMGSGVTLLTPLDPT
ncbi:hypothetical protein [Dyella sp. ASV21]|nr:hypothetical protein [Dyella sp. ASV21]